MSLSPKDKLGPYEVIAPLGAGGMGEVYRARDPRLDRTVALKILKDARLDDADQRARFLQEAKSLAALNHPNILTIYDVLTIDGATVLVMEFVPGKPLDRVIPKKGLRTQEALRIASQVAAGLGAAHHEGIVHRDLKPGNIMVTDAGNVKILDFGLAKLTALAREPGAETRTFAGAEPQTSRGTIMGTYSYMSPEQAEGKVVDGRSDIFSFGCVLYEMLTGERAFQGETPVSTLAAILNQEPKPAAQLAPELPGSVSRILARCLRKAPAERFQSADDLRMLLDEVREDSQSGASRSVTAGPARNARPWIWGAGAAMLALAAGLVGGRFLWPQEPSAPAYEFTQITHDPGLTTEPALSPDGKLVAYASDRSGTGNLELWVQHTNGSGDPLQLTHGDGDSHEPCFSHDGSHIVFRSEKDGGGLYIIPALGGEPRLVAKSGHNPRFSPDGSQIAYWVGAGVGFSGAGESHMFALPVAGGAVRQIASGLKQARNPIWLSNEKLLFWGNDGSQSLGRWWTAGPTGTPQLARDGERFAAPGALIGDSVVYQPAGAGNLESVRLRGGVVTGRPTPVTNAAWNHAAPSASLTGDIAFAALSDVSNVWSLAVRSNDLKASEGPRRITTQLDRELEPTVSLDGKRIAFVRGFTLLVRDLATGKETTVARNGSSYPSFSRDSKTLLFGMGGLAIEMLPDSGVAEKVCDKCGLAPVLSIDGRSILYDWGNPRYLGLLDVATKTGKPWLKHPKYGLYQAGFSGDGEWITFVVAAAPERTRLAIAKFLPGTPPEERDWIFLTDGSTLDTRPRWSPDGKSLYFMSDRDGSRCIYAQRLDAVSKRPVGPLVSIFHSHTARLSILNVGATGRLGLGVAEDKIVFNMGDITGNIWLGKRIAP